METGEEEGCGLGGTLWPQKGFVSPFLGLGWQGRAGSGVKPKWVTAEVAAGMGLRNCFRDRIKCVGVSRCLVQPLFGHLWVQKRFL